MNRISTRFFTLILIASSALFLSACQSETDNPESSSGSTIEAQEDSSANRVPEVSTYTVNNTPLSMQQSFVGVVKPDKEADIKSTVNGTVSLLSFETGQVVEEGAVLLSVDQSAANNSKITGLNNLHTTLSNIQNNLSLTDALTRESVRQAQLDLSKAETNLQSTESNLANALITTENDIKTAELQLQTAQTNTRLAVNVAESQLASAETRLKNLKVQHTLDLENTYENARIAVTEKYEALRNIVYQMDDILGIERKNKHVNDLFQRNLGAINPQTIYDAQRAYDSAKDALEKLAEDLAANRGVDDLLANALSTAIKIANCATAVDLLLEYSQADQNFTQAELENMRNRHNQTELAIQDYVQDIEKNIQSIALLNTTFESQARSAEKEIETAQNNVQNSQQKLSEKDTEVSTLNAQRQLSNVKAHAKSQTDNARFQVETSQKQLEAAGTALSSAEKNRALQLQNIRAQQDDLLGQINLIKIDIENQIITAPFKGTIIQKQVELGDDINPNQVIATIANLEKAKILIEMTRDEISNIKRGQRVEINETYGGQINKILPALDPQSRKYQVEIVFNNATAQLAPESFVDVQISYLAFKDKLYIPLNAIFVKQSGSEVFVIQNNKAVMMPITTGQNLGDYVEVLSGLKLGDEVIVEGLKFVEDGGEVKKVNF